MTEVLRKSKSESEIFSGHLSCHVGDCQGSNCTKTVEPPKMMEDLQQSFMAGCAYINIVS